MGLSKHYNHTLERLYFYYSQWCRNLISRVLKMATQSSSYVLPSDPTKINRRDFPADFVFGTASSAYQIEGATCGSGRGPSIWDTFCKNRPNMVKEGANGDVAINSYHLYKEDVKILKNLGLDAYRFSISWPRLLPGTYRKPES